jgi:patatin-like phospholipase/acyl hydrolase
MSSQRGLFKVLALDGGGAKGFYTLGVLCEIEAAAGRPLCEMFDLIYGTSTGSIIAALIARGESVTEILKLYEKHVPTIMGRRTRAGRTQSLEKLARDVFVDADFSVAKTGLGVVATRWKDERPFIFKSSGRFAQGLAATFVPGFGAKLADAVQASCSAFPFFERKIVETSNEGNVEALDGGYCANNPTLYAIADALKAVEGRADELRVLNVGVGEYPPKKRFMVRLLKSLPYSQIDLLQKTLEINTQSMDQLRRVLFSSVPTLRISDVFSEPAMATDLMENDLELLGRLKLKGRRSYSTREQDIKKFLDIF